LGHRPPSARRKNATDRLGYCGEGVVMSQVAGKILPAFLDGEGGEFASLPFVGGTPPWVGSEPLHALGVKAAERALRALAGEP
jgi:hypothetical protein